MDQVNNFKKINIETLFIDHETWHLKRNLCRVILVVQDLKFVFWLLPATSM